MLESVSHVRPSERRSFASGFLAYTLDTVIVYVLALQVSETLVFRFFAWIAPLLQVSFVGSPADWYLQHLELVTVIPAFAAGYVNVGRFVPALFGKQINDPRPAYSAVWAWTIPTLILVGRMLLYRDPTTSVLVGHHASVFQYFFEIQQTMPTRRNFLALDGARVLAQITFTAPFYAGLGYSLGAVAAKYRVAQKLVTFLRPEGTASLSENDPPTQESRSSLQD
jgi:hypothetical protein